MGRLTNRYEVRLESDLTWTVYDIFTGEPVQSGQVAMIDLSCDKAMRYRDIMNDVDRRRREIHP